MANQNFGVGNVDPLNGSNSNDGYWWDTPKQTIESALTAGFAQIYVVAGTHTVSSITSPVELVLLPGTHVFSNAPVVCTVPIGVVASTEIGTAANSDSPTVTAPGTVSDYFQLTNGNNNIDGGVFAGVRYDQTNISRSAIYCSNVSHLVAENNRWTGTTTSDSLFYATATSAGRSNWWRLDSNRTDSGALIYADNVNNRPFNGWVIRNNRTVGPTTGPVITVTGGQAQGWSIANNRFWNVASTPAVFTSPTNQFYWYGNRGKGITSTNNLIARFDNTASSYIEQSLGADATDGNVSVNGDLYSDTQPDTGTDGAGGRDIYTAADVRIVILGRY